MIFRAILAQWRQKESPDMRRTFEGEFSESKLKELNELFYHIYYFPNCPSFWDSSKIVDGSQVDQFRFVFVDCDLKDGQYKEKGEFLDLLGQSACPPSVVVDSGNGLHAYWAVSDLDPLSYLRLQRRLCRFYKTDPAVSQICQLMRFPGYYNHKVKGSPVLCEAVDNTGAVYIGEQLDSMLPPITPEDEQHCQQHYMLTYNPDAALKVVDKLPPRFSSFVKENKEVQDIWNGNVDDRSKGDYRLGHLMYAAGFSKQEGLSVLVNSAKALSRTPSHRVGYAEGIVSKIWPDKEESAGPHHSPTVRDLLSRSQDTLVGERFRCDPLIDDTDHGFRLGQVIGIIGGSGVGKTTLTLNTFLWFARCNPDYHHFFFSLEQPAGEIASRIRTICGDNEALYDMIHIVSNYADDGSFRHLSLKGIEEHLLEFQKSTGTKIGATVIDHIGVLEKDTRNGENDGLIGICRRMKPLAVTVNTMLIMLSQAPREKAGIGDLELDKSAAYGTVFFESFLDYCICLWQPLKRMYHKGAPTVMAFKFAKIRHKKQGKDRIQEDICYQLYFDPATERLRELTQDEEKSAVFWVQQATKAREHDRKTDIVTYESRRVNGGEPNNNQDGTGAIKATRIH